jgi:hypothetical protein
MKRSLVIVIPLFLLVLLNACDSNRLPPLSQKQWAAIQQTLQVTEMPGSQRITNLLNTRLNLDRFGQLEEGLVGKYTVTGIDFPYGTYFQVNMNCECAEGASCCDPRRMFFIAVQRMALAQYEILPLVPTSVQNMDVVCFNRNLASEVMVAPWDTVKRFLLGEATPAELSDSVTTRGMLP